MCHVLGNLLKPGESDRRLISARGGRYADNGGRVKTHALRAAFLHGMFGNRYTKDCVAIRVAAGMQELSAIPINLIDAAITPGCYQA